MNRPIKFRAWDKTAGQMGSVGSIDFYNGELRAIEVMDDATSLSTARVMEPAEVELMQFTGLTDKNGVEIYEGDFLQVDWNDPRYPVHNIGPVTWDECEARWILGEGGTAEDDAKSHMVVVGNIRENPELREDES